MRTYTHDPALILLVDDDDDDAYLIRRAFSRTGLRHEMHRAHSAEEMLALLRRTDADAPVPPDLILLDINMPGMGGLDGLRALRDDRALRTIPVVMLSTSTQDEDVTSSYAGGANSYISKPSDAEGLLRTAADLTAYWFGRVRLPDRVRRA